MYIECPNEYDSKGRPSIFLAGGITGCPDWQAEARTMLEDSNIDLDILSPRRQNFPIHDPSAATDQIAWEYHHLRKASMILFWFPKATLCPIVLYELGAWSMTNKPIFVGYEPGYQRADDVIIQTRLTRPEVQVVDDLTDLIRGVRNYMTIKGRAQQPR